MTYEMVILIISCIALSASFCACGLWWYEIDKIHELEKNMVDMSQRILMINEVIKRIEKRLTDSAN